MPTPPFASPGCRRDLARLVDSFLEAHPVAVSRTRDGSISVWLGGCDASPSYRRAEHAVHYAASTMKLPLLVAAYRLHARAEIDLDADVKVRNEFRSAFDRSRFHLDQGHDQDDETWDRIGRTTPLRWLVHHAIVKSGNLATNLVLDHVGAAEVAAVLADAGCTPATMLPRGIEDAAARKAGLDNTVTASDLARVMSGIAGARLGPEQMCRDVERVLALQEHRDKIPAGLPPGTYVANKTGWVDGVTHDVALVRPEHAEPYVLAVCTTLDVSESAASDLIAQISRRIWEGCQREQDRANLV